MFVVMVFDRTFRFLSLRRHLNLLSVSGVSSFDNKVKTQSCKKDFLSFCSFY